MMIESPAEIFVKDKKTGEDVQYIRGDILEDAVIEIAKLRVVIDTDSYKYTRFFKGYNKCLDRVLDIIKRKIET